MRGVSNTGFMYSFMSSAVPNKVFFGIIDAKLFRRGGKRAGRKGVKHACGRLEADFWGK